MKTSHSSGGVCLKPDHVAPEAGNHILLWGQPNKTIVWVSAASFEEMMVMKFGPEFVFT